MSDKSKEQLTEPELANSQLEPQKGTGHEATDADMQETVDLEELFRKSHDLPTDDQRVLEAERQVLFVRAEMENFRKRMQRDSELQLKYANLPLLRDLLDVVDNLNRATEAARSAATNSEVNNAQALLSGVEMVGQQLLSLLGKFGCKPIAAEGVEFDPNVHEAISQMPSDQYAAGLVAQEVAVGYLLHDRVIRPSSVIVSTGPTGS
jgi:molecular chaperone GrpE